MLQYLSVSASEPNWLISAAVGAVLGALVVPAANLALYPARRLQAHPMAGHWYSYHFSYLSGQPVLRYGTIVIRTGVRTRHVIERHSSASPIGPDLALTPPVLSYRGGSLIDEADHIVMTFSGKTHRETLVYRFLSRIPSNASVIPGVWMAYDHDLNPAAGAAIISREPLADSDIRRLLESWVVSEGFALHLRKSPR
ncbi:hypothetical protein ACFYS8_06150 [Kitasatospora sp. NPDC004615]|uniref:hypothetical protein n=1 Tax=unclassified Kitasatospora TaxID=2633591 RepID=UPI0036C33DE1